MKKVKVLTFQNLVTGKETQLILGFTDDKPVYQFNSKEIPITGEFTGFPKSIMIKWLEGIGYKLTNEVSIRGNEYYNERYEQQISDTESMVNNILNEKTESKILTVKDILNAPKELLTNLKEQKQKRAFIW